MQPYYAQRPLGQTPPPAVPTTTSAALATSSPMRQALYVGGVLASGALAYHGYKRNQSIGWALIWAIFGGMAWPIVLPIAVAQGFGRPASVRRNRSRRRR